MHITSTLQGAACLSMAGRWLLFALFWIKTERRLTLCVCSGTKHIIKHTSKRVSHLCFYAGEPEDILWLIGFWHLLYWKWLRLSHQFWLLCIFWKLSLSPVFVWNDDCLKISNFADIGCRNWLTKLNIWHNLALQYFFILIQEAALNGKKSDVQYTELKDRSTAVLFFSLSISPFPLPLVTLKSRLWIFHQPAGPLLSYFI